MPLETSNVLDVTGELRMDEPFTDLRLPGGKLVRVPTHLFLPSAVPDAPAPEEGVIPVIEERLTVGKRVVETGKVLLHRRVREFEQAVNETLQTRSYEVERVPVNRIVTALPETRQEGATVVYPVVEERLVVAKELVLVEEVRVTERVTERQDTQVVKLRREDVEVERVPLD